MDVAEERKGLDLVALDGSRRVSLFLGGLTVMEAVELIVELVRPTIVCIDSPSGRAVNGRRRSGERELAAMGIDLSDRRRPGGPSVLPVGPGRALDGRWSSVGDEKEGAVLLPSL